MIRIGIDLGGTKIAGVALERSGIEICRRRVATPQQGYDSIVEAIGAMVSDIEAELGISASVGVGTPGAISPKTGVMQNSNSVVLNGRPLREDLARRLGREIRMANDADCFALSEATDGAAQGADVVFGVIVGTGTGGGLVVHGRGLTGPNAITGEWGHNPLPWPRTSELPGPTCSCGRRGCIETFLSGPGMSRDHQTLTGEHRRAEEIVSAAQTGDTRAKATLERYVDRMGRALASVINVLDPDVIVLGGGLSNVEALYERVPDAWANYVFAEEVATRLLPAHHGDASGVRGAARLWPSSA